MTTLAVYRFTFFQFPFLHNLPLFQPSFDIFVSFFPVTHIIYPRVLNTSLCHLLTLCFQFFAPSTSPHLIHPCKFAYQKPELLHYPFRTASQVQPFVPTATRYRLQVKLFINYSTCLLYLKQTPRLCPIRAGPSFSTKKHKFEPRPTCSDLQRGPPPDNVDRLQTVCHKI